MKKSVLPGVISRKLSFLFLLGTLVLCGCSPAITRQDKPVTDPSLVSKKVSFAVLEDYDKGDDLNDVALDFALMNELEIDTMRCSFGWDDYEPVRGQYDFTWLEEFASLAEEYGIKLRPYIGYTPEWAGATDSDGIIWNNPPGDYQDWYNFVYQLALALSDHSNVLSYELYNEMNLDLWWDGSVEQYMETLKQGAEAVRAADPDAQVILGGLSEPDYRWIQGLLESGYARYYDILAFHAYVETWTPANEVVEKFLDFEYRNHFLPDHKQYGEGEPIWINEMGYATTPSRTEEQQANWWARAVSTFLAEPEIEHIGVYEIKDLDPGVEAIGDDKNYYLGLTYKDHTKKLAFHTVDLLTDLLDTGTLTIADSEVQVIADEEITQYLYYHLFKRPDGAQVLFVWDRVRDLTVTIHLKTPGSSAEHYSVTGEATPYPAFDGTTLKDIQLTSGNVEIFRINP
jgi:polysaccharide biosynthesis protein PslG